MPNKSAPRRSSPYAIAPKASGGTSAKRSVSKAVAKKSARPAPKSAATSAGVNAAAERVGTNLGKLANRLDAARKAVKARRPKKLKPVIGGVRRGHERGKTQSPDTVQATHQEWKERMKQDRVAHMGIGKDKVAQMGLAKKATHSMRPVARRLMFER